MSGDMMLCSSSCSSSSSSSSCTSLSSSPFLRSISTLHLRCLMSLSGLSVGDVGVLGSDRSDMTHDDGEKDGEYCSERL